MVKLVVFDWNGTILSDTFACYGGDNASLAVYGVKPITLNQFRKYFDIPVVNFYKNLGLSKKSVIAKVKEAEEVFHSTYDNLAKNARTRAGVRDLLKYLKRQKIEGVIFSNHLLEKIQKHLKRLKIEEYFSTIIANNAHGQAVQRRHKGEALGRYLQKHHLRPKEVLIVGDTVEEIEIARELGGISIALTDGYNSTARLKAAKPDYLLNDLRQIEGIISNLTT